MSIEFLNASQTAEFLGLKNNKAVLLAWKQGEIPGRLLRNKYIVSKRQLLEHIERTSLDNYKQPTNHNDSAFCKWKMKKESKRGATMG